MIQITRLRGGGIVQLLKMDMKERGNLRHKIRRLLIHLSFQ